MNQNVKEQKNGDLLHMYLCLGIKKCKLGTFETGEIIKINFLIDIVKKPLYLINKQTVV